MLDKQASAKFKWQAGNKSGIIGVSDFREEPRNFDDWKINLAVLAASSIAKEHGLELETIGLSLEEIDTVEVIEI